MLVEIEDAVAELGRVFAAAERKRQERLVKALRRIERDPHPRNAYEFVKIAAGAEARYKAETDAALAAYKESISSRSAVRQPTR